MGTYRNTVRRRKPFRIPMRVVAPLLALVMLVAPLRIITTPTGGGQVQAQIEFCDDTQANYNVVLQDCLVRLEGFAALEQQAIDDLLAAHQLPASDRGRLIGWERDAIRAAMLASLVAILEKPAAERTVFEQRMVGAIASRVQQRRIAAAQFSIDQYNAWSNDPCGYTAPQGFSYPYPSQCAHPSGEIFDSISPPSLEEFVAYGTAHIYSDFNDGAVAYAAAARAARMAGLMFSLVFAGLAGSIAGVVGSSLSIGAALVAAIHPALAAAVANTGSLGATASVAGAASVGAATIGAIVGIVIAAIVIIVIQGITVFTEEAIPGQLQDNLDDANTPVNLSQLINTSEGLTEIFAAFVLETMPDFPSQSPVPAQQATDRTFVVTDPQGVKTHSLELTYQCWNPIDCGSELNHAARLNGGWFVSRNGTTQVERMTLGIDYIDWGGKAWTAWRIGPQEFLHTRTGDGSEPFVSDEIKFKTWDGSPRTATINKPPSTPGIPTVALAVNRGEFRVSWPASTDPDGDPVTYILQHCGGFGTITTGGCDNDMKIHGLTTPWYDFTSDSPESHGNWTYRVRALDAESSGAVSDFSETVLVDQRPPFITFLDRTPANSSGWNNDDVAVRWTCTDSLELEVNPANAGVVDAIVGRTVFSEGEDQSVTQACRDKAGNVTLDTVTGINIDKTAPVAAHTGPYETNEGTAITLDGRASNDALSGIASTSWAVDQDDVFDDGEPASFTPIDGPAVYDVKLRVEDQAGNVSIVTTAVTSSNVPPIVEDPSGDPNSANEGELVTAKADIFDASIADELACKIDWGDGTSPTIGNVSSSGCWGSHVYVDDSSTETSSARYTVTFTVTDDDNASVHNSYVQTVNNVAPIVDAPVVVPSSSNEGEQVAASAAITDPGVLDEHTCLIDWGDNTLPTPGTVSNLMCSGTHTYADDNPTGTSADDYTVTFAVSDDDSGSDQSGSAHTVNNVAPSIDAINVPSVVSHANMVPVSVDASDAGGVHDPLTYAFDCDGDGSYERDNGSSNSVNCFPDPTTLSPTIGVQVTDDDLGVTTGSIELYVEKHYCANMYTGGLRDAASCRPDEMGVTLRPDQTTFFCANPYTAALRYGATGCVAGWLPLVVPGPRAMTICENQSTAQLSYRSHGCSAMERERLIPST